jgi:hypothetical protein
MFSGNAQLKKNSNTMYDDLNQKDKEFLERIKNYEIVHPQDVLPITNKFPDFYGQVGYSKFC